MTDDLKVLLGKEVTGLRFDGEGVLTFQTTEGEFHFVLAGDCCSSSYVTEILGVERFLGKGVVSHIEEAEYGERVPEAEYDKVSRHGLRLRCEQGDTYGEPPELLILWENLSNGYYDGNIETLEKIETPEKMQPITANWSRPATPPKSEEAT